MLYIMYWRTNCKKKGHPGTHISWHGECSIDEIETSTTELMKIIDNPENVLLKWMTRFIIDRSLLFLISRRKIKLPWTQVKLLVVCVIVYIPVLLENSYFQTTSRTNAFK